MREFMYYKITAQIAKETGAPFKVVPIYAVIDPGFDAYALRGTERVGENRHPVERRRDRLAGADLCEHRGQVGGELAAGSAYHPVEGGHRALTGRNREREQLGDSRELGEDPALPLLDLRGEVLVARQHISVTAGSCGM